MVHLSNPDTHMQRNRYERSGFAQDQRHKTRPPRAGATATERGGRGTEFLMTSGCQDRNPDPRSSAWEKSLLVEGRRIRRKMPVISGSFSPRRYAIPQAGLG